MKTLALLCLLCVLPQTKTEPTVTLILGQEPENVVIVTRSEAERLLNEDTLATFTPEYRERLRVALTLALGTTQDIDRISLPRNNTREFLDSEIGRGVRKPLQGGN